MLSAVVLAGAAGCGESRERLPARDLVIASGNRGGVYHDYGAGIARAVAAHLPRLRAHATETHGSVDNLNRLRRGEVDVAFTRADSALEELDVAQPPAPERVVALAKLYDSYVQVVVLESSRMHRLSDLRQRCDGPCRVTIGPDLSGTRLIADRLLAMAKLTRSAIRRDTRLDIDDAVQALADGAVDAVVWAGGLPTPAIQQLVNGHTDVRLLDLGEVAARLRKAHPEVYAQTRVPGSVYRSKTTTKLRRSVGTVSVANDLVAREDLPDRIAYRLAALLFEHRSELATEGHDEAKYLDRRAAVDVYPLESHPGAANYYDDAAG